MVNQERVILMTKMASYETHEGRKNISIVNYFRGDYIWFQILKSIICATIAFAVCLGLYIFYDFELFIMDIYKMDLLAFGKDLLVKYLIVTGIYAVLSYAIFAAKYSRAKNSLKLYFSNLKRLSGMYEK